MFTPACSAPAASPLPIALENLGTGLLDREIVEHRDGLCPTQITSFTFMATQSMPIVSYRPSISAMRTFVPTPSVVRASPWPWPMSTTLA